MSVRWGRCGARSIRLGSRLGGGCGLWEPGRSTRSCSSSGCWPTLVGLRHGITDDVLAWWFGVGRSTMTCAIGEVRPLLA
ncbi:transposase family protein [Streptomyces massasporeus]|uniref:transposase family protein n=1 Tax=Streptomyces massasporeus TaxID=67324 RepID=UPI003697FF13